MQPRTVLFVALSLLWPGLTAATPQATPANAGKSSASVVVFPFENAGHDPRYDWLGEGLAELSVDRLSGEGRLLFTRQEALAAAERMGLPAAPGNSARFTRATMLKVAEQLDADFLVHGTYTTDGKNLSITAYVIRLTPASQSSPLVESGALEDLSPLHARVAWQVLRTIDPAYPFSRSDYAQRFSRIRLDAFENYIRGVLSADDAERLRLWREATRLEPEWSDPAFALGGAYFATKDYATAATWYSRIALDADHGTEAAFYAGACYLLRNEYSYAERVLTGLVEKPGTNRARAFPEALNNLAIVKTHLQRWDEAAALLQRATQLNPDDEDYWFNLGLTQLRAGDSFAAVRPLREAVRRAADDAAARALLVFTLEKVGRMTEAASEREAVTDPLPGITSDALAGLERVKRKIETQPAYLAASESALSPRRAQSLRRHMAQGREALEAGRWPEAERDFSAAVLLAPDTPEAHAGLAEAYEKQMRVEEAVREWRAALWSREDAETRLRLARALLALDPPRPVEARTELRAVIRQNAAPKLREEARKLLEELDSQQTGGRR